MGIHKSKLFGVFYFQSGLYLNGAANAFHINVAKSDGVVSDSGLGSDID